MELWKDIEDFPTYQISTLGKVKSLKFGKERILKPNINNMGYLYVNLRKDKKQNLRNIHRLVGQAFLANPLNYPVIDHINRIKTDNRVENLRWTTQSENCVNKLCRGTNTGHRNIYLRKDGIYTVAITRHKQLYVASKKTLQEAIDWRDKTLIEVSG